MKKILCIVMVTVFAFSCEDVPKVEQKNINEELDLFKESVLPMISDDIILDKESAYVEYLENAKVLFIPARLTKSNTVARSQYVDQNTVVAVYNQNNVITSSYLITTNGSGNTGASFTGRVHQEEIGDASTFIDVDFINGQPVGVGPLPPDDGWFDYARTKSSGRTQACRGYKGVLRCAGYKFEANCCGVEEIIGCYMGFVVCYITRQIDCALMGCPVTPVRYIRTLEW